MNLAERIVSQLPLEVLWKDNNPIEVNRACYLNQAEIKRILNDKPVIFVVANLGEKLMWIEVSDSFAFWKNEAKNNIAENLDKIDLTTFPGNYAFIASKWEGKKHPDIILLEKIH